MNSEPINAIAAAKAKLRRIIDREGDANGIRREPEYLDMLIAEENALHTNKNHDIKKEVIAPKYIRNDHNQPLTFYHKII
jgi:hypothetical protein